ncbi:MAG: Photosystem I reaction center subunit III [Hormoscilla sp.]
MRRLFALLLILSLWVGSVPAATADIAGLVPCSESEVFLERADEAMNTTADPNSGAKRFERYAEALCGEEDGLPRLIVDGRWSHAGDFLIPSILFLYITGWIGWVGRAYLIAIRDDKKAEEKEIIIDVPLALKCVATGPLWPLAAFKEITTGEMFAPDNEIPISPR